MRPASITVNGVIVPVLNEPVGNIGVISDPNINMTAHVSEVIICKSPPYKVAPKCTITIHQIFTDCPSGKDWVEDSAFYFQIHAQMCPLYMRELYVKPANSKTLRSNTKNLLQITHTNRKSFCDRAFCAYAPQRRNELPENIKAADSIRNFKTQLKKCWFKRSYLTIWTITIWMNKWLLKGTGPHKEHLISAMKSL